MVDLSRVWSFKHGILCRLLVIQYVGTWAGEKGRWEGQADHMREKATNAHGDNIRQSHTQREGGVLGTRELRNKCRPQQRF